MNLQHYIMPAIVSLVVVIAYVEWISPKVTKKDLESAGVVRIDAATGKMVKV